MAYPGRIADLPVINPPVHRSAALLDHLARRMRRGAEHVLGPLGMRTRHLVTLTVLRDVGGATQQSLAGTLRIDRTNLVGLLNELESDGLIERRRSPQDRRRHIVELTEQGWARLASAESELLRVEDEILSGLDADEREQLFGLLQRATRVDPTGACAESAIAPCTEAAAVPCPQAAADPCPEVGVPCPEAGAVPCPQASADLWAEPAGSSPPVAARARSVQDHR